MNRILQRFTVYDLVIIAIMAAIGIVIKPVVVPLAHIVTGPLMIPSGALSGGLYMMWMVIAYGIVKKPGTATLTALVQALLVFFTGIIGSHGIMSLITYTCPGIVMDIVLLAIGHRVCCRGCAVIAGAAANVTGTITVNVIFFQVPGVYLILVLSLGLLSGAVGGFLAWELIKVIEKYHLVPKPSKRKIMEKKTGTLRGDPELSGKKPFKLKLSKWLGFAVIVVLFAAAGTAAYMNAEGTDKTAKGYSLCISVGDETKGNRTVKTYTLNEIKKMPAQSFKAEINSSSGEDEEGTYKGVELKYILDSADKKLLKTHDRFILTAGDGFSSAVTAKEVRKDRTVFVVYEKDGKELLHMNEGGKGPMRIVMPKDTYGTRSTQFLVKIIGI
ncbi:MAG: molybdopterin-dependent oxidoreductase [Clostridiales bacterium]|nr:molybdopterin-dependent oxidoreductase [Clostridiales bacterium]